MDKRIDYMTMKDVCTIIGNGDHQIGWSLLREIAARVKHARNKHPWGKNTEFSTPLTAYTALDGEMKEWLHAINFEDRTRQTDEILDVLAVAIKMANWEWEQD